MTIAVNDNIENDNSKVDEICKRVLMKLESDGTCFINNCNPFMGDCSIKCSDLVARKTVDRFIAKGYHALGFSMGKAYGYRIGKKEMVSRSADILA